RTLANEVDRFAFSQYLFERQWSELRGYLQERRIGIIGDLPIFVAHDSADVWAHPDLFQLHPDGRPEYVAGVPPDYFSETGQRWGNPLYRWDRLRQQDYRWWIDRFRRTFSLVDVVRVDHFRGFEAYWEIPAAKETAVEGRWAPGPGADFFRTVEDRLGRLPIIAEDLGLITPEVNALRDELGMPGMRVIQFAFDGDPHNIHLPRNYTNRSVAYTGTHDNDTITGWWSATNSLERERARAWMGDGEPEGWDFIEAVLASPAATAIIPLQDLLGLSSGARMNTPGKASDNWTWRIGSNEPDGALAARLRELTERTDRLVPSEEKGLT
ncbi:MAG: 4-alpha-glucanotransferase, partial [Gemmatimonas sp.]|nr:4-alpha-glucanotransferase [Gemmatimonas sp.]